MPSHITATATRAIRAIKGPYLRPGTTNWPGRNRPAVEPKPKKKVDHEKTAIVKARNAGVKCQHCKERTVNRPRGLCWRCYYAPGVAELYPVTSKYARRGVGNFTGEAPLAPVPTTAAPGTPEKVEVMEKRAKEKQAIFHPADALWDGDPRPLLFMRKVSEKPSGLVNER